MAKLMTDKFREDEDYADERQRRMVAVVPFKENSYEYNTKFIPASSIYDAHTTPELVHFAESDEKVDIEARVLCATSNGLSYRKLSKKQFIEACKSNRAASLNFREADVFGLDEFAFEGNALVGDDYIPLLGGPFNRQLYMQDYLRMASIAFHAWTHDPLGRRIVSMIRQFVLGKGYRIDVVGGKDRQLGEAIIAATEKVNNLQSLMSYICTELSVQGEVMVWKLPQGQQSVMWQRKSDQVPPKVLLPRYKLIDPSTVWEIVTMPESISEVLYYQIVAPTQYQIYTAPDVPSLKFIVQQVPGNQVGHFKVNVFSNEKRGRSDLFPALGYMKRLRDSVNYSIIADQKAAAWAIDTTVEGSAADLAAYAADQQALGAIAPAGSEFIHTSKITRKYLANEGSSRGVSNSFDWCIDMIAASVGIPVSYFGIHKSGGQTRASALVGTEPVTKMFEERQLVMENILRYIIDDTLEKFNLDVQYEVTFPELITQDRSAKIRDLITVQQGDYFTKRRTSEILAKELSITEFDFEVEQAAIKKEQEAGLSDETLVNPLTGPSADAPEQSGLGSDEKHSISKGMGF